MSFGAAPSHWTSKLSQRRLAEQNAAAADAAHPNLIKASFDIKDVKRCALDN